MGHLHIVINQPLLRAGAEAGSGCGAVSSPTPGLSGGKPTPHAAPPPGRPLDRDFRDRVDRRGRQGPMAETSRSPRFLWLSPAVGRGWGGPSHPGIPGEQPDVPCPGLRPSPVSASSRRNLWPSSAVPPAPAHLRLSEESRHDDYSGPLPALHLSRENQVWGAGCSSCPPGWLGLQTPTATRASPEKDSGPRD